MPAATPLTSKYQSMNLYPVIYPVSWKFEFDSAEPGPAAINATNPYVKGLTDSPNIGLPQLMLGFAGEVFNTALYGGTANIGNWGDGSGFDGAHQSHTYTTPGFYRITAIDPVNGGVTSCRLVIIIWHSDAAGRAASDTNIWHYKLPLQFSGIGGSTDSIYSFTATLQLDAAQYTESQFGFIPEGAMIAVFGEVETDGVADASIPLTGIAGGFARQPHYHNVNGGSTVSWIVQGICGFLQDQECPEFSFLDPGVVVMLNICLNSQYRVNGHDPIFGDILSLGMPLNHFIKCSVTQVWAHLMCHLRVYYKGNAALGIPDSPSTMLGTRPGLNQYYGNIGQFCKIQVPQGWDEFDNAAQLHSFTVQKGNFLTVCRNLLGNEGWVGPFDTRFFTFRVARESFYETTQPANTFLIADKNILTESDYYLGAPVYVKAVIVANAMLMAKSTSTYTNTVTDPNGNVIISSRSVADTAQNLTNPNFDHYASQMLDLAKANGLSGIENIAKDPFNISVDTNTYQKVWPLTPNTFGAVIGPLDSVFCEDAQAYAKGRYYKSQARRQFQFKLLNRPGVELHDGVRVIESISSRGINWPSPGKLFVVMDIKVTRFEEGVYEQLFTCLEADPYEY